MQLIHTIDLSENPDANLFKDIPLSLLNASIVPVVVYGNSYFEYIGTAFNISPDGVFITASHVADEALQKWKAHAGSQIAVVMVIHDEIAPGTQDMLGGPISVVAVVKYEHPGCDLALLRAGIENVDTGEPLTFPCLPIGSKFPKNGDKILGLGYPKPSLTVDEDSKESMIVTLDQKLHFATGNVSDVFETGRDVVMMPGPGFQTEAVFEGGMSGGPVLNTEGFVCGVISFSLRPDDYYPKYTSYAAPALAVFPISLSDGTRSMTVYEMAQAGLVGTDENFHRLEIVDADGGMTIRATR